MHTPSSELAHRAIETVIERDRRLAQMRYEYTLFSLKDSDIPPPTREINSLTDHSSSGVIGWIVATHRRIEKCSVGSQVETEEEAKFADFLRSVAAWIYCTFFQWPKTAEQSVYSVLYLFGAASACFGEHHDEGSSWPSSIALGALWPLVFVVGLGIFGGVMRGFEILWDRLSETSMMRWAEDNTTVPIAASAILLLVAIFGHWPYGFYRLLRLVVCLSAGYVAFKSETTVTTMWLMIGIAILFNPIYPIVFDRTTWQVLDAVVVVVFGVVAIRLRGD